MTFAFHRSSNDWLISDKIMDQVGEAIDDDVEIIRDYDVPYVAGYSVDGKRFYIDHALEKGFDYAGDFFDVTPSLILHEATEKGLRMIAPSLAYQLEHQVALRAERAYVEAMRIPWMYYNRWFDRRIKVIGSRKRYEECPVDLDLHPYLDEEDWVTLKKMFRDGKPLWDGKKTHAGVK